MTTTARAAAGLPGAWADFTKSFAIYPATNVRVRSSLDHLVDLVRTCLAGRPKLGVTLHRDVVLVGDVEVEVDLERKPNIRWLEERLDSAALAGVAFLPSLDRATLLDFTRKLVEHASRRQRVLSFRELWPEHYEGLLLLDRRFDGVFVDGADANEEGEAARHLWSGRTRQGRVLVGLLATSDDVAGRLERLGHAIEQAAESGVSEGSLAVDFVGDIVDLLPGEVLRQPALVRKLTNAILDELRKEVEAPAVAAGRVEPAMLEALVLRLVRQHYAGGDAAPEAPPAPVEAAADPPCGNDPRDDIATLVAQTARLPAGAEIAVEEVDDRDELLGIYLHFLVHLESRDAANRLHPLLKQLLTGTGESRLTYLGRCLDEAASLHDEGGESDPLDRVLVFLHQSALTPLARDCGFVTPNRTKTLFPQLFLTFVRTLDWRCARDVEDLEDVCRTVGTDAILASKEVLQRNGGLSYGGCDAQILAHPHPALLPLVHLILEEVGTARSKDAEWFLKRIELDDDEACMLALRRNPGTLPVEYLSGLAARDGRGEYPPGLRDLALSQVADFLAETAGRSEFLGTRLHAVRMLGELGGPAARALLDDLARSKHWIGLHREPAPIRKAAADAILGLGKAAARG